MEATEGLEGFVAIVTHGSLTAAARSLGVPRPTLSRQLTRLEQRLGVRLLHRTTRRVVATRAGEELYRHARRLVEDAHAALDAVRQHDDVPRGRLRVTAPPSYDALLAAPILAFTQTYPEVELEVEATSRVVDLVAEGFDVALRGGVSAPPDHVQRPLIRSDAVAVASPAYLKRAGTPKGPEELVDHVVILGLDQARMPERSWPLLAGGDVRVTGRFATNDLVLRRAAAERGDGIALLPLPHVREALGAGRLVGVLPDVLGTRATLSVVYPERAFLHPRVRAFVDHLLAWAETLPPDPCAARRGGRR